MLVMLVETQSGSGCLELGGGDGGVSVTQSWEGPSDKDNSVKYRGCD